MTCLSVWRGPALLAASLAGVVGGAAGQRQSLEAYGGGVLEVEVRAYPTAARPGGFGWVLVEAHNQSERAQTLELAIETRWGRAVEIERRLEVEGRATSSATLPLPNLSHGVLTVAVVGGGGGEPVSLTSTPGSGWSMLVVGGDPVLGRRWRTVSGSPAGAEPNPFWALPVTDLPPRWWMLSGFDLVVVDGSDPLLTAAAQQPLEQLLSAGSRLIVLSAERLPAGALRAALAPLWSGAPVSAAAAPPLLAVGFGRALCLDAATAQALRERPASVAWWSTVLAQLLGSRPTSNQSELVAAGIHSSFEIPGLGEVPVRWFIAIVVVFVVLVGPVNYAFCQVRRRMELLLITIPVLGFGSAVLLLGYGLVAEGFGTRSAERVVTVIDQSRQRAVAWRAQKLYASFGSGVLEPRADTMVAVGGADAGGPRLTMLPDGRLGGGLLPPRTVTSLDAASFGGDRERLRFRRRADGAFDILAGPALQPSGMANTTVLCLDDGRCFMGAATRVEPVAEAEADLRLAALLAQVGVSQELRHLIDAVRTRGGYFAMVDAVPAVDDLGLRAEVLDGQRLAIGFLGPGDLLDD